MALVMGKMTKAISKGDVEKMYKRIQALQSRAKNAVEKADKAVEQVVETLETTSTSFALGLYRGRYGQKEFQNIPMEVIIGAGLHAAAFLTESDMAPHMRSLGNGAIACYAAFLGQSFGEKERLKSVVSTASVKGTDTLSDAELASMAR